MYQINIFLHISTSKFQHIFMYVHHCSQCKYFNEKSPSLLSLTRFASQCLPILMEYSRIFTHALENTERAHCNSRKCYRNEKATSKIMWFTYRTSCSSIAYKKSRNCLHWSQPGAGLMTTSRRCRCVEATYGRPTEGICAVDLPKLLENLRWNYRNCWGGITEIAGKIEGKLIRKRSSGYLLLGKCVNGNTKI
jgi:hypothetical protein